jgi:hypothetical protein
MQSITNERKIARGKRIGQIATFLGLGFLVAGFIISLVLQASPYLWLSLVCLLLGLVASTLGTTNMNRWIREPRADQALAKGLKGFDDRFRLYNYSLPAAHVLLSPVGLYVLTAMGQDGVIRFDGTKFRRDFSLGRLLRFMADEGLGRPLSVADSEVQALQKLLAEHNLGDEVDIENIVVFYNPRAELLVEDPPRPIVVPKALKKAVRKQASKMPEELYRRLEELFNTTAS